LGGAACFAAKVLTEQKFLDRHGNYLRFIFNGLRTPRFEKIAIERNSIGAAGYGRVPTEELAVYPVMGLLFDGQGPMMLMTKLFSSPFSWLYS